MEQPTPDAGTLRFQTGRVATVAGGHAVHDTYVAFLPPLLPVFVEQMALSNTGAGVLSAFVQLPSLLQAFIGHIADRRTLRGAVIAAPAIAAGLMSMLGWAGSYAVIALLLAVVGFNSAVFHAVAPPLVGRLSGSRLGRGMAFFMVGGELGRTLGPLIVASTLALISLRGMAVLMVIGFAASAVLYRQLRHADLRPPGAGERPPWRVGLRLMGPAMVVLGGLVFSRSFTMVATGVYLPIYLTSEGASLWVAGAALSLLEAAGVAGALIGGWVSDRVGRRPVLVFGHVGAPLLLVWFLVADGWLRVPLLILLGFVLLSIQPVNLAMAQEVAAPESRAFANGVYLSISFGIRMVATAVFGVFADVFGLTPAFVVGAVLMLCGSLLVPLIPSRSGS